MNGEQDAVSPIRSDLVALEEVVVDSNVVLDWWLFGNADAARIGNRIMRGEWLWVATEPMADELRLVLARPLPERWEHARTLAAGRLASAPIRIVEPPDSAPPSRRCSDPSDQKFADLARSRKVSRLFTKDKALLRMARSLRADGVVVTTPSAWAASLADQALSTSAAASAVSAIPAS